ncbi:unnamed protein product [Closterium sp. NIES-64]|nr:unnamed protein product [Closterium sp. NIES-64]
MEASHWPTITSSLSWLPRVHRLLTSISDMAEQVTIRGRRVASTSSRPDHRAAFTEAGLASLFSSCPRLESLELHCPLNLTALPPSICGLTRLTALKITARGLKRLPDGFRQLSVLVSLSIDSEALEKLPTGFATHIDETAEPSIRPNDSRISDAYANANAADGSQNVARQNSHILPQDDNSSMVTSLGPLASLSLSNTPSPALPLPTLSALRHLSLDRCRALRALPSSLPAELPLLETLELRECALLSAVPACLPARFCRLRALTLAYLPSVHTPLPALLSASRPSAPDAAEEAANGHSWAVSEGGVPCKEDARESRVGRVRLELLEWKRMQEIFETSQKESKISFCDSLQSLPASLTALAALCSLHLVACGALTRLPSPPVALRPLAHGETATRPL